MAASLRHGMIAVFQGQQMSSLSRQLATLSLHYKYAALSSSLTPSKATVPHRFLSAIDNAREISSSAPHFSSSSDSVTAAAGVGAASSDSTEPTNQTQITAQPFDPELVESLLKSMDGDLPVSDMPDPFVKDYQRCFLCKQNVKLDHKNIRLLSQFVSPHTGRIYGRAVTGLCIPMQKRVAQLIKRSRNSGYMPFILKDSKYLSDPQPFDPMAQRKVRQ